MLLFSCFLPLAMLAGLVTGAVLCFSHQTRKAGIWVLSITTAFGIVIFLTIFIRPKPVAKDPPQINELVGIWECTYLSKGFVNAVTAPTSGKPTIYFSRTQVRGSMIPARLPSHRYFDGEDKVDITKSTPSGNYGFRIGNALFYCYRTLKGEIILRQFVDVGDNWKAEYRKISSTTID